jgi:hypothetical protein
MSNVIKTIAPISLENLKVYFSDKSTRYLIDYKNSKLQEQKILTYLSNLDLNCDIEIEDFNDPDNAKLLQTYFGSTTLVNIPTLERAAMSVLFEYKGLIEPGHFSDFIKENLELVKSWVQKLDSLVLFNTFTINDEAAKQEVRNYPEDPTDSVQGINWVSLLKNQEFFYFYQILDVSNLRYYSRYFSENMFKGRNLYSFWATEQNPMFLITWGILEQQINSKEWSNLLNQAQQEIKEQQNATPV